MAALDVLVPDLGDFSDVPVIEVMVAVGDTVAVDDPLVEIESDKATMEVPAPFAGKVTELLVSVGDKVGEGVLIARVEPSDAAAAEAVPQATAPTSEAASATAVESAIAGEEQTAPEPTSTEAPAADAVASAPEELAYASPLARRVAADLGVELSAVHGSGRLGRITVDDVKSAQGAPAPAAAASTPAAGKGERVPLSRIQQISARNLSAAWQTIPHVTHHEDADITDLEAFRKALNAEQQDVKVTMVALLLKACQVTLDAFPRFASSLDGDELVVKGERHLGFAADTPNGLVVPVVRDVDQKGILQLAGELMELSGKARNGKLSPKEMSGAVFTISSLGGIGGTGFTPIVNPPQVAILGVVRSSMQPVWNGADFTPRLVLPLSLSYDHRVIDGAAAARFCVHLASVLKDLRRALL